MGVISTQANTSDQAGMELTADPYRILRPRVQTSPVIFASPHSGDFYPQSFIDASRLDPVMLRRSEDAFVHELYETCTEMGAPLLKAIYPRAYVDLNREPYELDPTMFDEKLPSYVNIESPRVNAGLGTVARMVTNGAEIYKDKLSFQEVRQRIEALYHPYHQALKALVDATRARFGTCLLIDCHSMPSIGGPMDHDPGLARTDVILGDRYGTSCVPWVSEFVQKNLEDEGFVVRRNRPYAGGFTTHHYGKPDENVHVLQIELNRVLYMDERSVTRLDNLRLVKTRLQPMISALCQIAPERLLP